MAQQPSGPHALADDFDHHLVVFPTRKSSVARAGTAAQSAARPVTPRMPGVRSRVIRQVVVLEVSGRLGAVVRDLDKAIEQCLADGPRGVVCDLSAVLAGSEPIAVEVLATAGRHVRDWPGIPVVVASPEPRLRETLTAHPLGRHLMVTESLFSAVSLTLASPVLDGESRQLAPHPTAPRAAREFITRTLLGWGWARPFPPQASWPASWWPARQKIRAPTST